MDFQTNTFVQRLLKLLIYSSIHEFDFLPYFGWNHVKIGLIFAAVVNTILPRLHHLFSVNVYNPKSGACTESTIRTLKYLSLTDVTHIFIVEFSPSIVPVILNEVEVVATISVAFVDTNRVQVIRAFVWFFLNVLEDICSVHSCFLDLHLNLLFLLLKASSMLP